MTPAQMEPGIPYIVTRGSSWAELRKGDRVEWAAPPGPLFEASGARTLRVTRKAVEYRHFGQSAGSWEVEIDRGEILERVARLRRDADRLEAML